MKFVGCRQTGFGSCYMNYHRAHRGVGGERFESVAQMTQAQRAAAHQLLKRRSAGVFTNRTTELERHNRVARKLGRPHDNQPERRDHGSSRDNHRNAEFPMAGGAREAAEHAENRNHHRDPELAAYPQVFQERFIHWCYTVAFWHRAI